MIARRITLCVLAALVLSGCGFRPLYGERVGGDGSVSLSGVTVAEQDNRPGQLVRNELLQAMTGDGSRYVLKLKVADRDRGKSSLPGTATSRFDLILTAQYQLVDQRTGSSR
jgi:LPS-assembly lipoprotein